MRKVRVTYICDICRRKIEHTARDKRYGLVIRERGILIREDSTGNICHVCRPILKLELESIVERVAEQSLIGRCGVCKTRPVPICPNRMRCQAEVDSFETIVDVQKDCSICKHVLEVEIGNVKVIVCGRLPSSEPIEDGKIARSCLFFREDDTKVMEYLLT
jgi:hypothetical protein